MANKKNSIIMLIVILAALPFMWQSMAVNAAQETAVVTVQTQNTQPADWSKNATEQETQDLIAQADKILNQQQVSAPDTKAATSAAMAAPAATKAVLTPMPQTVNTTTAVTQPAPTQQPSGYTTSKASVMTVLLSSIPGIFSLIISCAILVYVNIQLKKNKKAGRYAENLMAEIQDLEAGIKQWEIENYSCHVEEVSQHIMSLQEASEKAGKVNESVKDTIHKGITLNQKSLEILKKANKGISDSLTSQVKKLEGEIAQAASDGIEELTNTGNKYLAAMKKEKDSLDDSLNSKPAAAPSPQSGSFADLITNNHSNASTQPSPAKSPSMMDIITKELEAMNTSSKPGSTASTPIATTSAAMSHAEMLRESIARQKAAITTSSFFSNSKPAITTTETKESSASQTLKSSGLLKGLDDLAKEHNKELEKTAIDTPRVTIPEQPAPAKTEEKISVNPVGSNAAENKPEQSNNTELSSMDSKALMESLTYAEKWKNYPKAAEICEELVKRTPNKPEIYDIWGQMLAKQAAKEKGAEAIAMLKEAGTKMQKASMLDGQNYKIFNNWGVILKNLSLSYTDTRETEKTLALARRKFETSLSLNPKNHEALNNWGNSLMIQARYRTGTLQESLLKSACEKFEEAVALKSDKEVSYYSWGNALFRLANCKKNPDERNKILEEARQRWEQANAIKPGIATKELRVLRSMVPPLNKKTTQTFNGKPVEEYKFKTLSK